MRALPAILLARLAKLRARAALAEVRAGGE
jgi:hypothetical protein